MPWQEFHHEAMATTFALCLADQPADYARQAATAAWREIDRLENELSRYLESSDIARANRLLPGETISIGDDTLNCLLLAAEVTLVTDQAFDAAYASARLLNRPLAAPPFTLDPAAHTLTSHAARLHLDLGAIGKGYALDRIADLLREWEIPAACLQAGGSTALALAPPAGDSGWPIGIGDESAPHTLSLAHTALSASGLAVKGAHLIDPRTGLPATRRRRIWAQADTAALSDALSTAFFVWPDETIAAFCLEHPEVGAAISLDTGALRAHGTLLLPSS